MESLDVAYITLPDNTIVHRTGYTIIVDNRIARSFNVNIDTPEYFTFAYSKAEAIGKMMLSDFSYKHRDIINIYEQ